MTLEEWRPLGEYPSALEELRKGDEIFIYDPKADPQIFPAEFESICFNRRGEILGASVLRECFPNRSAYITAYSYGKSVCFVPWNRIGCSRIVDRDFIGHSTDYDA